MRFRNKCWRPFRRVSDMVKFFRHHAGLRHLIKIFFRMLREEFKREKFKLEYNRPDDFTICIWQKKPNVLPIWIAYRFFVFALAVIFFLVAFFAFEDEFLFKSSIYLTHWTFFVETMTFMLALVITVQKFHAQKKDPSLPPLEVMPVLYKITWCFYNTSLVTGIVVSVIFWSLVYTPEQYPVLFVAFPSHVFNSMLLIMDYCLNAFPYQFLHFYMPLVFSTIYGFFSLIYQLSGGTGPMDQIPIYRILDWRNWKLALTGGAMELGCCFTVHCIWWGLNLLKHCLRKKEPV